MVEQEFVKNAHYMHLIIRLEQTLIVLLYSILFCVTQNNYGLPPPP
jgi:hypothetical protein